MKHDVFQETQNICLPELKCLISWIKSQKDQSSTFDFYLFIITIKLIFFVQFVNFAMGLLHLETLVALWEFSLRRGHDMIIYYYSSR